MLSLDLKQNNKAEIASNIDNSFHQETFFVEKIVLKKDYPI